MAASKTSVTIQRPLLERLQAYLARLKAKAQAEPGKYRPALSTGRVGLADAIEELLYQHDLEESRKRSYGQARREGRNRDPRQSRQLDKTDAFVPSDR